MSKSITIIPAHAIIEGVGWVTGGVSQGKLLPSDGGKPIPLHECTTVQYVGPPKEIKINEPKKKKRKAKPRPFDDFDLGAVEELEPPEGSA